MADYNEQACLNRRTLGQDLEKAEAEFCESWSREFQRRESRAAEGSQARGGLVSRCNSELGGGGGPENMGGNVCMEELAKVLRSKIVSGLEREKQNHLMDDAVFESVELL